MKLPKDSDMTTDFPPLKTIEDQIIAVLVNKLLEVGYLITVDDGEDNVLERSKDAGAVIEVLKSTDSDRLFVYSPPLVVYHGWVLLIYGNDQDVISDYTTNLEPVIRPIYNWIDEARLA